MAGERDKPSASAKPSGAQRTRFKAKAAAPGHGQFGRERTLRA